MSYSQQYDQLGPMGRNIRVGPFARLRMRFDSSYAEYMAMMSCGPEMWGRMEGVYFGQGPGNRTAGRQNQNAQQAAQPAQSQTQAAQQAQQTGPEDVYKAFISLVDRMNDGRGRTDEKLVDALHYMQQNSQVGETERQRNLVENLTKALYQTQQEHSKTVNGLVHELSVLRNDYVEAQSQYQHLIREMGDQVKQIIDSYELRHAKELESFKGFQSETTQLYQKMLERAVSSSEGMVKAYLEQQRQNDEKFLSAFMEEGQRYRNMLTDTIEKLTSYQQRQPARRTGPKRTYQRTTMKKLADKIDEGNKKSDETNELLKKIAEGLDNQKKD